jgi:hypothetical protein
VSHEGSVTSDLGRATSTRSKRRRTTSGPARDVDRAISPRAYADIVGLMRVDERYVRDVIHAFNEGLPGKLPGQDSRCVDFGGA